MLMHKMLFVTLLILYALFTTNVALAQLSVDNPSEKKALSNIGLSSPLIQKISDKGIYNVTIKSGQSSIPSGLNFEIVFLNASSPILDAPPSGAESNATLDSPTARGFTVPSVIEHVIPVKSFDIRVTTIDGQELLKKVNEIPRGGRILENFDLNNYIGNITINLDNIVPNSSVNDTIKKQPEMAANQTDVRDSVKIDGQVVKS
jgi:hypothetical protein